MAQVAQAISEQSAFKVSPLFKFIYDRGVRCLAQLKLLRMGLGLTDEHLPASEWPIQGQAVNRLTYPLRVTI